MRVVTVVGARPQFVKAAPVGRELRRVAEEFLLHTGQHYDQEMSQAFFGELGIPEPDLDLGVGSGSHGRQTARMLEGIEGVLAEQAPDWVVVYGDTNSTLAGVLAAAKAGIPVAHVEAGLRSFRRDMPEEINRVVADHLARLLLCPTETAVGNLAREGITEGVELVGDVMADALEGIRPCLSPERAARWGGEPPYLVATVHRAENVDDPERLRTVLEVLGSCPLPVVLPVHPRTREAVDRLGWSWPANVRAVPPVGYADMLSLAAHAEAVLTDSGGLQKEAVALGTRCLTLREETEWPETLEGGWNTVVGLDPDRVKEALASPAPEGAPGWFRPGAARAVVEALGRAGR